MPASPGSRREVAADRDGSRAPRPPAASGAPLSRPRGPRAGAEMCLRLGEPRGAGGGTPGRPAPPKAAAGAEHCRGSRGPESRPPSLQGTGLWPVVPAEMWRDAVPSGLFPTFLFCGGGTPLLTPPGRGRNAGESSPHLAQKEDAGGNPAQGALSQRPPAFCFLALPRAPTAIPWAPHPAGREGPLANRIRRGEWGGCPLPHSPGSVVLLLASDTPGESKRPCEPQFPLL